MTYQECLTKFNEYGIVTETRHPIVMASGLPGVHPFEVVLFQNGARGQVISLAADSATIMILDSQPVRVGDRLARTNTTLQVPVGNGLLGCVLNALGDVIIAGATLPQVAEYRPVDAPPPGITRRARVTTPLFTGVSAIDLLVPLGHGQRELVVGDRKVGKTLFLLNVLKAQAQAGAIVVYASIGKATHDTKKIYDFICKEGLQSQTVIVAASPSESPSLIYFTPYTAMTIAEYFRDLGRNVLVILDDLSTHAKFYRELSLLARKFPGRDSYPGDSFFIHAKLLERAGNFRVEVDGSWQDRSLKLDQEVRSEKERSANASLPIRGELLESKNLTSNIQPANFQTPTSTTAAISCLPVAETTENDLTDYIVSNLIGITDGHILFDSDLFDTGRRPAVNALLSVTRVGRQTHDALHQDLSRTLLSFIVDYEKSLDFSHFGEELSSSVRDTLQKGERLLAFLNQPAYLVVPPAVEMSFIGLMWSSLLKDESGVRIHAYRQFLIEAFNHDPRVKALLEAVVQAKSFKELIENVEKHKRELATVCKIKEH